MSMIVVKYKAPASDEKIIFETLTQVWYIP